MWSMQLTDSSFFAFPRWSWTWRVLPPFPGNGQESPGREPGVQSVWRHAQGDVWDPCIHSIYNGQTGAKYSQTGKKGGNLKSTSFCLIKGQQLNMNSKILMIEKYTYYLNNTANSRQHERLRQPKNEFFCEINVMWKILFYGISGVKKINGMHTFN